MRFAAGGASISSVTVAAGGSATVQATIAPDPALPEGAIYGGYLLLTPSEGGRTYRVPYAGLKGDYQSRGALSHSFGLPWLTRRFGDRYFNRPNGETYTMQGAPEIPYLLVTLAQQARRLTVTITDADSGDSWHEAERLDYTLRSATDNNEDNIVVAIDGTTHNGRKTYTLPNGRYRATVSVLKALGDAANPAHTETWTSPVFTIARP